MTETPGEASRILGIFERGPDTLNDSEKVAAALDFVAEYGLIEGEEHRKWVLDQVVRVLTGCPATKQVFVDSEDRERIVRSLGESEAYQEFVVQQVVSDEGVPILMWDTGVEP